MDKDFKYIPLSESNVSLKLSEIQRRCADLINEPESLSELTLEEPAIELPPPGNDPYNRG